MKPSRAVSVAAESLAALTVAARCPAQGGLVGRKTVPLTVAGPLAIWPRVRPQTWLPLILAVSDVSLRTAITICAVWSLTMVLSLTSRLEEGDRCCPLRRGRE